MKNPAHYELPNGDLRTTCGDHRIHGWAIQLDGTHTCRGCGSDVAHESFDETLARKRAEANGRGI